MNTLDRVRRLWKSCKLSLARRFLAYSGNHPPGRLTVLISSNPPPWKRLISPTLSTNERADLIMSIFSDPDEAEVFEYLSGERMQHVSDLEVKDLVRLVDYLDEVRHRVAPPYSLLKPHRLSTVLTLPVSLPGDVCVR